MLGFASSFDNAAAGLSLGLQNANILLATVVIGIVALIMTFIGGILGEELGAKIQKRAPLVGGIALIGIGIHSLLGAIL